MSLKKMSSSKRSKSFVIQTVIACKFWMQECIYSKEYSTFFHFFSFLSDQVFSSIKHLSSLFVSAPLIYFLFLSSLSSFPLYAVLPLLGSKHQITVRNLLILFTGLLNFNTIKSVELIFLIWFQRQRSFDSGVWRFWRFWRFQRFQRFQKS